MIDVGIHEKLSERFRKWEDQIVQSGCVIDAEYEPEMD
jgi:hypothetical protein